MDFITLKPWICSSWLIHNEIKSFSSHIIIFILRPLVSKLSTKAKWESIPQLQ